MQLRHRWQQKSLNSCARNRKSFVDRTRSVKEFLEKQFFIHSERLLGARLTPKQRKNKQLRVRVSLCMTWSDEQRFCSQIIKNLFIEFHFISHKTQLHDDIRWRSTMELLTIAESVSFVTAHNKFLATIQFNCLSRSLEMISSKCFQRNASMNL